MNFRSDPCQRGGVYHLVLTAMLAMTLIACSRSPNDPCALLLDANDSIGIPVTAAKAAPEGRTEACTWKSADGRLCGSASILGPGWTEVPDVDVSYKQLTTSLSAFGPLTQVMDVGNEAYLVDTGASGALLVFRKGDKVVTMVSACNGKSLPNDEFVKKLGREVASQLQ